MSRVTAALACAAFFAGASASLAQDRAGSFDFYVLSLSWSPTWCATDGRSRDTAQCDGGHDFGFVVHGLWPQYESGYPEFCSSAEQRIPARLADSVLDVMPDRKLVFAQWRKHGTCTGLAPQAYFETVREAFRRIAIPGEFRSAWQDAAVSADEVERAFARSNAGLRPSGMAVSCGDGWLEEVRICMTRDLLFRACPEVDRRGCRQSELRLTAPG